MACNCRKKNTPSADKGEKKYPGVAQDIADNEKVDHALVKEETHDLNNNPRDNPA